MTLQAFHNNSQTQQEFLSRIQNHYDADEIIHDVYWENGKGCAIGCMTHSNQHKDLEALYNIPEWLAKLIDVLFDRMENKYSKEFVLEFAKTVCNPSFLGFDNWKHVYHQLCLHILEKECKNIDHSIVKQPISDIMTLHRLEETDKTKWCAARSAALSAEFAAESALSVDLFAAGSAAEFAALSAAESATYKSIADKLIELLITKYII